MEDKRNKMNLRREQKISKMLKLSQIAGDCYKLKKDSLFKFFMN